MSTSCTRGTTADSDSSSRPPKSCRGEICETASGGRAPLLVFFAHGDDESAGEGQRRSRWRT